MGQKGRIGLGQASRYWWLILSAILFAATQPATASPRQRLLDAEMAHPAPVEVKPTYSWLRRNVFYLCDYCHVSVPGVNFMRHADALKQVVPGQPEASKLYQMVFTHRMPPGRGGLHRDEIVAIYEWIKQGAKDD